MAWWDDRLTLFEFLHYLEETGRITTAIEACRIVEKPHRWQLEYDAWRAEQFEETQESLVDAEREAMQ